ncbi:unnamed protein product, partial [Sphagnum jensenii]
SLYSSLLKPPLWVTMPPSQPSFFFPLSNLLHLSCPINCLLPSVYDKKIASTCHPCQGI